MMLQDSDYSFCRVLNDMADGDIPNGHEHLTDIQNTLNNGGWDGHPFLNQFSSMVEEYRITYRSHWRSCRGVDG